MAEHEPSRAEQEAQRQVEDAERVRAAEAEAAYQRLHEAPHGVRPEQAVVHRSVDAGVPVAEVEEPPVEPPPAASRRGSR